MTISTQRKDKKFLHTRWLIWGILVLGYAINFFYSLSMGVVKDSLMVEFSLTESLFVSIANTFSILYLVMQIPTGILVDTLGAKKTAGFGTLLTVIGIFLFATAKGVPSLYIGRSLVGLGASVSYVSILKIQSKWFESEKFGTMTGITCFVGAMGGVVGQATL
ncbi:MFS transporter [Chakrabartyella piscis]|uniref:MFS transporter n=1 Tax=Chakrabartyella piscis TaxID=2918914 RepID=UPI002958B71A|nr:MFS transporter [Chakrabartyella piscis]